MKDDIPFDKASIRRSVSLFRLLLHHLQEIFPKRILQALVDVAELRAGLQQVEHFLQRVVGEVVMEVSGVEHLEPRLGRQLTENGDAILFVVEATKVMPGIPFG